MTHVLPEDAEVLWSCWIAVSECECVCVSVLTVCRSHTAGLCGVSPLLHTEVSLNKLLISDGKRYYRANVSMLELNDGAEPSELSLTVSSL